MSLRMTIISLVTGSLLLWGCTSAGQIAPEHLGADVACAAAVASENPYAIVEDCPDVMRNVHETIEGLKTRYKK